METTASQSRASDTQKMLARLIALAASPIGRVFFNRILARQNPYTAGIGAKVVELRPGYAKFTLKDRKKIRNHLNSIHAVALTNLGEMTSGLALNVGLPANVRCIVTQITTEYLKKARDWRHGLSGRGRNHRCGPGSRGKSESELATRPAAGATMNSTAPANLFLQHAGIEVPVVCGAMYPCSNPELVAAVSEAGGLGVIQPISLTYVHGHGFREGIRTMRRLTTKPLAMNALIERSSRRYHQKMVEWVDIALEEGVRFFITSLGKPDWVVKRVHAAGGYVYHDVTERKWALKGMEAQVDGFIAVNNRAGGHAGERSARDLFNEIADLGLPILCAGGISTADQFREALDIGYQGVQMGTRFIATRECNASMAYKNAIVSASDDDIVLTERITGVPVAVIKTPYIERSGTKAGLIEKWLLRGDTTKRWVRTFYALRSLRKLKHSSLDPTGRLDYWQAGKSVSGIHEVLPAADIMAAFKARYTK
jgi:nitronate monooxygenase